MNWVKVGENLPEVEAPVKKLGLKTKLVWTGVVLIVFFVLGMIPLYGLSPDYQQQLQVLEVLLAAKFGSLITLGIGPIVTASIILQLLIGADVIKLNLATHEGRAQFQSLQKLFSVLFIVFENAAFVFSGSLPAVYPSLYWQLIMVIQLVIGGLILMLMDEVVSKWGIGSGISLFIAAGVSMQIFVKAFSPFKVGMLPSGAVWQVLALIAQGVPGEAIWPLVAIIATIVVFLLSIYAQSIKVSLPLTFARVRGISFNWPIRLLYTSNIPVILVTAFMATTQVFALMLFSQGIPLLGTFEIQNGRQVPVSGFVSYLNPPTIRDLYYQGFTSHNTISILVYLIFMTVGAVLFSVLWVKVGGQGPENVADQIMQYNLFIPGFRPDKRILVMKLEHYIMPMAVIGGAVVGLLAALADVLGALARGTGVLLSVLIIYQFYDTIIKQHRDEVAPLINFIRRRQI